MTFATTSFGCIFSFPFSRQSLANLAIPLVLVIGVCAIAPRASLAQTVPYSESFETDGEGTRYTSQTFDGGANAYFKRTNGSDIDVSNPSGYTSTTGASFWASEYNDGPNGGSSRVKVVRLQEVDVSMAGIARITADFATGCATGCFDGTFQTGDDQLRLEYSLDGGTSWVRGLQFAGISDAVDVGFAPDTNGDGIGDGTPLTNDLQPYSVVLPASAEAVTVRIWVDIGQNEEIAFDNIQVEEVAPVGVPFLEDFETDGNTISYFPSQTFDDGDNPSDSYFKRTDGSDIVVENGAYTGFGGSFFWAGADLDGANSRIGGDLKSLTLPEVDVLGEDAVQFTGLFGAGKYDPTEDESFNTYDFNDSLVVRYSTDGGATFQRGLKFSYDPGTSGSSFSRPIGLDADFDGVADGPTLLPGMQPFSFDLPSSASTVIIRLDMYLQNGNEQLAFDDLRVEAVAPNPIQLVNPIADQSVRQFRTGAVRRVDDVFEDQNGDALTLSVSSSNASVVRADLVSFGQWIEFEGLQLGASVVTFTAENTNGDMNSTDFNVTVTSSGPFLEIDVRLAAAEEVCTDPADINTCADVPETGDGFGGLRRDTLVVDPGAPVAITYVVENTGTLDVTTLDVADDERGPVLSGGSLPVGATSIRTQLFDAATMPGFLESIMRVSAEATDGVLTTEGDFYRIETPAPEVTVDVLLEEAAIACTDPADPATCEDLSPTGSTPTGERRDTLSVAITQPVLVEYLVANTGQTTLALIDIERYTQGANGNQSLAESIPVGVSSLAPGDSTRVKRIQTAPATLQPFTSPFSAIAVANDPAGNATPNINGPGRIVDVFAISTPEPSVSLNALIGIASDFCTDDTDPATCSDLPRTGPTPTGERRDSVDVVGGDRLYTQYVVTNTGQTRLSEVDLIDDGDTGIPSPIVSALAVNLAPGDSVVVDRLYDVPAQDGDSYIIPRATGRDASGTESSPSQRARDLLGIFAAPADISINALVASAAAFCSDITDPSTCTSVPRSGSRPSDGGRVDTLTTPPVASVLVEYVVTNTSTAAVESLTIEDTGQGVVASETGLSLAPGGEYVARAIFDAPAEVQRRPYVFTAQASAVDANAATLQDAEVYGLTIPAPQVSLESLIAPADAFCTDLADIATCSDIPNTGDGFGGLRRDTTTIYAGEPVFAQYRITNEGDTDLAGVRVEDANEAFVVSETGLSLAPGQEVVLEERFDGPTDAGIILFSRIARGEDAAANESGLDGPSRDLVAANVQPPSVTLNALVSNAAGFCTDVTDVSTCSDIPTGGSTPTGARRDTVDALPSGAPFLVRYRIENTGPVDATNLRVTQRLSPEVTETTVIAAGSIPALAPGDTFSQSVLFGSETTPGLQVYLPRVRGEDPSGNALQLRGVIDAFGIQTQGPAFRTTTLSGPASVFCQNVNDPSTCSLERQKRSPDPARAAKSGSDAQAVRYAFYNDGTVDFVQHSLVDDVTGVVFTDRMETVPPLDSLVIFRIGDEVAGIGDARTATWTAITSDGDTFTRSTDEAPLPVELVRFHAQVSGRTVTLEWQTASEENNAGFAVQQRRIINAEGAGDDRDWTRVGFVEGAGTTAETRAYRFDLGALAPGEYQFRLRQIDVDGRSALSHEVTAQIGIDGPYRLMPPSPHPIRSASTLSLITQASQPVRVELYDLLGRRVATLFDGEITGGRQQEIQLDSDGLANGMYFIRATGEHFRATERVTVVR